MSESNNNHSANSNPGEVAGPASWLPHAESPSIAPDDLAGMPAETAKCETTKFEVSTLEPARSEPAPLTATRGTALVLAVPRTEEAATGPWPESASRAAKSRRLAFTPAAARIVAMLIGAAIGSAATAGLLYLRAASDNPTTAAASFDRINRELETLKGSINGSAEQSTTQIPKIADRMDRAEKSQADTGAKLARTADSLDRLDHRVAANAAPAATGDVTGSLPSSTAANLPAGPRDRTAAPFDPKQAAPARRELLSESRMWEIHKSRFDVTLPGIGRIEGVKRPDGSWVVATSRARS
jgi:hypothetical protein